MQLANDNDIPKLPQYRIFGPTKDSGATLTMVVKMVIEKSLVEEMGSKLDGVIFVMGNEEESLKEAIKLMEANPLGKLLIIDPFGLYTQSRYATAIESYNKLSKFALSRTLMEFKTFPDEIKAAIEELQIEEDKIRADATGTSYKVTEKQIEFSSRILGYLKHDLPKVIRENGDTYEVDERQRQRFEKLISDARDAFGMKSHVTEAQVVGFIQNTQQQIDKAMEGDILGVYCDIDDTILNADGTIIEASLLLLEKLEREGHKIHIWTGGDLAIAKEKLSKTPFARFPLVSKYDYAGANAEIVIDNVSPEKFALQTGITAKKFIRV